jgi:AcrR family transcriptional regulator
MEAAEVRAARVGRPRLLEADSTLSPRGQILDAAAALFAELGFAATSTRAIADRVGIRQASIYYHFAGKDEILVELLTTSVRPSLDFVRQLEDLVPQSVSPAGALFALAQVDIETLQRTPHNIGTLYLLPDVQHERYEPFRRTRAELQETYGRLGRAAATKEVAGSIPGPILGAILIQLAEVVIQLRRSGQPADAEAIASSCLRALGLSERVIAAARRESDRLLSDSGELTVPE